MDNVQIPDGTIWLVAAIGILVQLLREFAKLDTYKRFIPYLCIMFGVIGSVISGVKFPDCVMLGVTIGLMAAGGYDALKAFKQSDAAKVVILAGLLFVGGCLDVTMSPRYSAEVRKAAIITTELNSRCQAGDCEACKAGLDASSKTLKLIVDGLDGKGGE